MPAIFPVSPPSTLTSTSQTRPCSQCRKPIPSAQTGKTCFKCRAKDKAKRDKKRDRDMKRVLNLNNDENNANDENPGGKSPKPHLDVAKKASEYALTGVKVTGSSSPRVSKCPEYQTSEALYANLSSYRNLRATYSVISTSKTPITLERRVFLVSRALRAELKKNEGGFDRAHALRTSSTVTSHSESYACKCGKGPLKPQNTSSASTIPLKRTSSDISRYFGVKTASSKENEERPCGGEIEVTVEEDSSHWLGIKAHRVTIRIDHKGGDA